MHLQISHARWSPHRMSIPAELSAWLCIQRAVCVGLLTLNLSSLLLLQG